MIPKQTQFVRCERIFCALVLSAIAVVCTYKAFAQSTATSDAKIIQSTPSQTTEDRPATSQPMATMSVEVNVVNVLATVRDKHGKIINNLGKDDFTLEEDGRQQNIHYFAKETDLPLTLGLLVDTSFSQRRVLDDERSASSGFFNRSVREDKDKAFVIHFDREVELLQDLTASHEKLQMAIGELQTPRPSRDPDDNPPDSDPRSGRGQGRRGMSREGTLLYDAVYLASDELMKKQMGRKALVVISDGVDHGSKETLQSAIESAQRADTVVYCILFKDEERREGGGGFGHPGIGFPGSGRGGVGFPGGGGGQGRYPRPENEPRTDGKKILEQISKETGGRLFEVSKKQPISQIYAEIEEEMRNQYNLGYTPDRAGTIGPGYHKIQLTTKEKSLVVQARDGYYAEK